MKEYTRKELEAVTQEMINIVAAEWEAQHKLGLGIDLSPETCGGLTLHEIDLTTSWLYKNS